ncbi:unnamed protein product [Rotaria sp. Silwood2]|nr:unnamed protein product [Rotaria sp. Silwood2]
MSQPLLATLSLPDNIFWEAPGWDRITEQFRILYTQFSLFQLRLLQRQFIINDARLVSVEAMTSETFNVWFSLFITQIDKSSMISSVDAYKLISDILQANQFHNRYMTSWKTEFSSFDENYILRNSPVILNNGTCSCPSGQSNCTEILIYYDWMGSPHVFPGIMVGYSSMSGLSQSTFECFYDDDCVYKLNTVLGTSFTKFNHSAAYFPPTTPIKSIMDEYLPVSLNFTANYSTYFQICAPSTCQYHYMEQHNFVYIFTTLLGLYGGLTAGLHIFV